MGQPRVIKQNRGSAGEGIWIIKLKSGEYCSTFGEASCADDELLDMMEANDNHAEEHTVAEFIEFCVNGRTDKSGTWTSKGTGKYLEGGKEAVVSSWTNGSAHVLSKENFGTTRLGMDLSALSTRSLQRAASQLLVAPAPFTLIMDQTNQSLRL